MYITYKHRVLEEPSTEYFLPKQYELQFEQNLNFNFKFNLVSLIDQLKLSESFFKYNNFANLLILTHQTNSTK